MAEEKKTSNKQIRKDTTSSGISAFTFQFEEPRCRGVLINSLKSTQPIRAIWSLSVINKNGGGDVGSVMQRMPEIPGMNVIVIAKDKKVIFEDPLEKDDDLLERINAIIAEVTSIAPAGGRAFKHCPKVEREMTDDEFKTFMLEMQYHNSEKSAIELKLQKGTFPSDSAIAKLAGRELYDVRSNSHIQPKYVEDVGAFHERLIFNTNG